MTYHIDTVDRFIAVILAIMATVAGTVITVLLFCL